MTSTDFLTNEQPPRIHVHPPASELVAGKLAATLPLLHSLSTNTARPKPSTDLLELATAYGSLVAVHPLFPEYTGFQVF